MNDFQNSHRSARNWDTPQEYHSRNYPQIGGRLLQTRTDEDGSLDKGCYTPTKSSNDTVSRYAVAELVNSISNSPRRRSRVELRRQIRRCTKDDEKRRRGTPGGFDKGSAERKWERLAIKEFNQAVRITELLYEALPNKLTPKISFNLIWAASTEGLPLFPLLCNLAGCYSNRIRPSSRASLL